MSKTLASKVAATLDMSESDAEQAIKAVMAALSDELKAGEKITLNGFGIFEVSDRPAREGRNPRTGEAMQIAASKAVKFKPSKTLKDAVNS